MQAASMYIRLESHKSQKTSDVGIVDIWNWKIHRSSRREMSFHSMHNSSISSDIDAFKLPSIALSQHHRRCHHHRRRRCRSCPRRLWLFFPPPRRRRRHVTSVPQNASHHQSTSQPAWHPKRESAVTCFRRVSLARSLSLLDRQVAEILSLSISSRRDVSCVCCRWCRKLIRFQSIGDAMQLRLLSSFILLQKSRDKRWRDCHMMIYSSIKSTSIVLLYLFLSLSRCPPSSSR